jgi:hypothetical protein
MKSLLPIIKINLFSLLILFSLIACSPHPSAGNWQADNKNNLQIDSINIVFEGNADFYTQDKEKSIHRCFWSAIAEQTIKMQCVHSDNTNTKVNYQFIVTQKGHAKLTLDNQLIGTFSLQAPKTEASFF